ncbi:hypothetical protein KY284_010675 [Solanum tuberosum]|nr:hypothetical protein KY284_010675 [Solanum tuberosum]
MEEEVHRMNIIENLQYVVFGKFSYGWPDIEELHIQIPKQCNVKGDCKIDLEVVNEDTRTSRVVKIRIQLAMVPKYCKECKLQGHIEQECRVLRPELRARKQEEGNEDNGKIVENSQPEATLIRVGRQIKKSFPTNKTTSDMKKIIER